MGIVNVLNAAAAVTTGKPIDEVAETGQLVGAVILPWSKADLPLSSANPDSGPWTYPSNKTRGRGDDVTGNPAHA